MRKSSPITRFKANGAEGTRAQDGIFPKNGKAEKGV